MIRWRLRSWQADSPPFACVAAALETKLARMARADARRLCGAFMSAEIVSFDVMPPDESSRPDADRLIAGDPVQQVSNRYAEASGQFYAGRWSSTPGIWRVRYTEHEFCHMLAGRVRIVSESGSATEFVAGQSFVVPAGFAGTWEVIESATKLYAIFEGKPSETAQGR